MTKSRQPITSATNEIVTLLLSATFSAGGVNGHPAHEIILENMPIGAGLCASAFEGEMPLTS